MKVVNILGTSPPVVTEFVDWLSRMHPREPFTVICIGTSNEDVRAGYKVIELALRDMLGKRIKEIKYLELPFEDPTDEESFYKTVELIVDNIRGEKAVFNLAGGRKNMVLAGYVTAMLTGSETYHIIATDVKTFNLELEQLRDIIKEIYQNPKKYEEYRDRVLRVFFPDPSEYFVIKIPVIPFLRVFVDILKLSIDTKRENININLDEIRNYLKILGYIQVTKSGNIVLTDKGEKLFRILELL